MCKVKVKFYCNMLEPERFIKYSSSKAKTKFFATLFKYFQIFDILVHCFE